MQNLFKESPSQNGFGTIKNHKGNVSVSMDGHYIPRTQ